MFKNILLTYIFIIACQANSKMDPKDLFQRISDILRENEEMRDEIARLKYAITDNITELSMKLDAEIEDRIGRLDSFLNHN